MKIEGRRFHRRVWSVLGIVLPLVVLGAIFVRQVPPDPRPAIQLEKPVG